MMKTLFAGGMVRLPNGSVLYPVICCKALEVTKK